MLAQESTLQVKGVSYQVYQKGFEKRKSTTPVIIFENGLGVGMGHWGTLPEQLSTYAPVFAYNRAGVEKSGTDYRMPTPQVVAENLKAILQQLRIPPPYLLVGHSMGGIYTRAFAGYYPQEIAGLIFLDPADFTETKEDWKSLLLQLDIPARRADEMIRERLYQPATPPDSARFGPSTEIQVLTDLRRTDFAALTNLPLPQVPIYFFIGGKFEVPPELWSKDFSQPRFFQLRTDMNIQHWRKFIYSSGKGGGLIYLSNSGHFIHRDDARQVSAIIKMILEDLKN
jgi:pimeloyl-ACP methyl ester carboxylesterase